MANLNDVAKIAGVSPITVSRVLNNTAPVADETRRKVIAAIKATGYTPNLLGRSLKTAKTNTILVVFSMYIPNSLDGIIETASQYGYDVSLSYLNAHQNRLASIKSLESNLVDGVILMGHIFSGEELQELAKRYHIVQLADYADYDDICSVSINDEKAAYDITSLLIDQGYQRIGVLASGQRQQPLQFSTLRMKGYQRALQEHNLQFDPELVYYQGEEPNFKAIVDRLIEPVATANSAHTSLRSRRADAIVCFTDIHAASLIRALHERGIKVPDDLAITGFDDFEIASQFIPSLTTVSQPFYDMAVDATRLLVDQLQGRLSSCRKMFLQHKIIRRETTR